MTDDGKLLKTRFDEIFSATKYIKALDALKKVRLEKNQLIKQLEIERKHLETYKSRSEQLRRDSEENSKRLELLVEKKKDLGEKLKPIRKQLEFFYQIRIELEKIDNEKDLIEKQIKELLLATKDCLFTGSDSELEEYVEKFKATTDQMRRKEEKDVYEKIENIKHKIQEINSSKSKVSLELGALKNRSKDYFQNKKTVEEISTKLCSLIDIENENIEGVMSNISSFKMNFEKELNKFQEDAKRKDIQLQNQINDERDKKSKIEQSIQNKKESVNKYQQQYSQIEQELCLIEDDRALAELNKNIKNFENQIENQSSQLINVDEIKSKIKKLDGSKLNLKQKELEIDEKIKIWHQNSKLQTELAMLRNEKKIKLDQIRKTKIHIEEDMENFFANSDNYSAIKSNDSMLKTMFESENKELDSQLISCESNRKDLDKNLSSNEFKRKMLNEDLRTKEKQLTNYEDTLLNLNELITNESDIDQFDSILDKLKEEQKNLLDEKGFLSGVDKTYKRFLQQLEMSESDEKHSCPVCMRMFKNVDEVSDTVNELRKYTHKIPKKVQDLDQKLKTNGENLEKMINAISLKESYTNIKKNQLPELKEKIDDYDKNVLPKLRSQLTKIDSEIKNLTKRKSYAASLHSEIFLIDKCTSEIKELDKKIENLILCGNLDQLDDTDLETLSDQKMIVQSEIEMVCKNIENGQEEISRYYVCSDRIHKLREQLNEYKARRNELESKCQKKSQLVEKRQDLEMEMAGLKNEIFIMENDLMKICRLVEDLIGERATICEKNDKNLAEKNYFYQDINNSYNKMVTLMENLKNYEHNDEIKIAEYEKEFKSLNLSEKEMNAQLDQLYQEADKIKLEIAKKQVKERELNDNLTLRQKRSVYEAKKEQYNRKLSELQINDKINFKDLKFELEKLEKKREDLNREINEIASNMNILEGRLLSINEELALETIKNAMEKYKNCICDLKVLQYSVMDIEKYYKALDRAIMNYHQIKMNEINKIVKQLWRQVYRGVDIDYIEIRSEEENATDEQTKSRKTYNYRVVIVKGDTCLDMRGRCSAGQKVLASIIIRLALAETFCLNSGILALDEPTTNLDRDNIESLASALIE